MLTRTSCLVAAALFVPVLAGAAFADYVIRDNETGGDGHLIGTWDAATKTLRLTQDVTQGIVIADPGITIDGARADGGKYLVDGAGSGGVGIGAWTRHDVTVRNCSVHGWGFGIDVVDCDGSTIEDNVVEGSLYGGILVSSYGDSTRDVTIRGNVVHGSEEGIRLNGAVDCLVEGNTVTDSDDYGIRLHRGNHDTIRSNTVQRCGMSGDGSGGITAFGTTDSLMEDNVVEDSWTGAGFEWLRNQYGGNVIRGNTTRRNRYSGVFVTGSHSAVTGNTSTEDRYGVVGDQASDSLFERNTVTRAVGVGIYGLAIDRSGVRKNVTVDCGPSNYGTGIYAGGTGVFVEDNHVTGGGTYYGIQLDGADVVCRRNVVTGFAGPGIGAHGTTVNVVVSDNEVHDCVLGYYGGTYGTGVTFSDNLADGCAGGMYLGSGVTAERNRILDSRRTDSWNAGYGIWAAGSNDVLRDNEITDSDGIGIILSGGRGLLVEGNTVLRSGRTATTPYDGHGIYLQSVTDCTIRSNRFEDGTQAALRTYWSVYFTSSTITGNTFARNGGGVLLGATDVTFEANTLADNGGPALLLTGESIRVLRNTITGTLGHGIKMEWGSRSLTVAHNRVTGGSGAGLWFGSVQDCLIYDNCFDNAETITPNPYAPANAWSVPKTAGPNIMGGSWIGGNYWADAAGTGWSQTHGDADGDGFCDAPFAIAPGNVDELPLVKNTPPSVNPTGDGVYEIGSMVTLGGSVADNDGDLLEWTWRKADGTVLFTGTIQAQSGGAPIALPNQSLSTASLGFGVHALTISVDDRQRLDPVVCEVLVEVTDTTKPLLAPTASLGMLWPPNHQLVAVTIDANASDNDGAPTLAATVASNEADDGLGDGDTAIDVQDVVVDQATGIVTVQLRAERSGRGTGRVYTVTLFATDRTGNVSSTSLEVLVPRSRGQGGN